MLVKCISCLICYLNEMWKQVTPRLHFCCFIEQQRHSLVKVMKWGHPPTSIIGLNPCSLLSLSNPPPSSSWRKWLTGALCRKSPSHYSCTAVQLCHCAAEQSSVNFESGEGETKHYNFESGLWVGARWVTNAAARLLFLCAKYRGRCGKGLLNYEF